MSGLNIDASGLSGGPIAQKPAAAEENKNVA